MTGAESRPKIRDKGGPVPATLVYYTVYLIPRRLRTADAPLPLSPAPPPPPRQLPAPHSPALSVWRAGAGWPYRWAGSGPTAGGQDQSL